MLPETPVFHVPKEPIRTRTRLAVLVGGNFFIIFLEMTLTPFFLFVPCDFRRHYLFFLGFLFGRMFNHYFLQHFVRDFQAGLQHRSIQIEVRGLALDSI
jgi:hypothetical protein